MKLVHICTILLLCVILQHFVVKAASIPAADDTIVIYPATEMTSDEAKTHSKRWCGCGGCGGWGWGGCGGCGGWGCGGCGWGWPGWGWGGCCC